MDIFEAIFMRRSIRKFQPKAVEEEKTERLLQAGMYAPTARNTQSWEFIVVNQREMLDKMTQAHPYAHMLKEAPLAIVVCGNLQRDESFDYQAINGSAATQNILLAAHALGLGAVWLGVYGRQDRMDGLSTLFKLPPHVIPVSAIAIGYPAEEKEKPERYDNKKVHYNG